MSYLEKNLLPQERLIYRARLHWIIYLPAIVLLVLAVLCYIGARQQLPESRAGYTAMASLFGLVGFAMLVARWITRKTSEFGITDKRVLIKAGLIRRKSIELLLRQVEAIGVEQGITARVFGYGTIVVTGTGGTKEPFARIAKPMEFRRQVQAQTVAADERPFAAPASATLAPGDEKTCPQCAEHVKRAAKVCRFCGHQFTSIA